MRVSKGSIVLLIVGLIVGFAIGMVIPTQKAPTQTVQEDFSGNLTKAIETLNDILSQRHPGVSVKVVDYKPAGEFYLVSLEISEGNRTEPMSAYISEDGMLFIPEAYVLKLKVKRIQASEDDDPWTGNKSAPVTIVIFSDYTCPYCAKFAEVERMIAENYSDKVKIVFRDFPVHGEISYKAAEAADCALEQGKFWEYHYILFERQREWINNVSKLYDYAKELGLDVNKFKACLDSDKYRDEVRKDYEDGIRYGVQGTPTFFVNGKMYVGYRSYDEMVKIIESALK